MWGWTIVA
jgi:hypothetical protein